MARDRIRVGIVGVNPTRGFAAVSHVPALQALPGFELVAICASTKETASATASHYGVPLAFGDAGELAEHPDVDLVTVCVKVQDHFHPVMAAIAAGKPVLCEWPLGRNTAEAREVLAAAEACGVSHAVGLQGDAAPGAIYARDLVGDGYVGEVQSATVIASVAGSGIRPGATFQALRTNGSNMLSITGGHTLNLLRFCLGEIREISAFAVNRHPEVRVPKTGELVRKDTVDQIVAAAMVGDGIPVAYQIRSGGASREPRFVFEIHGDAGDLVIAADPTSQESMQRGELWLEGRNGDSPLARLEVPASYRVVPDNIPKGAPYNVAQLYTKFAQSMRDGTPFSPDFATAVACHAILDALVSSSEDGVRTAP
jgi:predicted dehydrogenase